MKLFRRLTRPEIDELQAKIPSKDVVAQKSGLPVYHGSKESIEESMFPWLKARRRARRSL